MNSEYKNILINLLLIGDQMKDTLSFLCSKSCPVEATSEQEVLILFKKQHFLEASKKQKISFVFDPQGNCGGRERPQTGGWSTAVDVREQSSHLRRIKSNIHGYTDATITYAITYLGTDEVFDRNVLCNLGYGTPVP